MNCSFSFSIFAIFPFPLSKCVTSNPFFILKKCQQSAKLRSDLRTRNNWENSVIIARSWTELQNWNWAAAGHQEQIDFYRFTFPRTMPI